MSKRTAWNSTLPKPTKPLGTNRKRKAKLHAEHFGPPGFVEHVHAYGCIIAIERQSTKDCRGKSEAAHVRGRKNGWRENIIALCAGHHRTRADSFHNLGSAKAFDAKHATDSDLWAAAITSKWDAENPDQENG